jgi:hypothetical protein
MPRSWSEHDFRDLKDVQDGVGHPQNRVQDEGKGVRGASRMQHFSLRLYGFASEKIVCEGRHTAFAPLHDTSPRTGQ